MIEKYRPYEPSEPEMKVDMTDEQRTMSEQREMNYKAGIDAASKLRARPNEASWKIWEKFVRLEGFEKSFPRLVMAAKIAKRCDDSGTSTRQEREIAEIGSAELQKAKYLLPRELSGYLEHIFGEVLYNTTPTVR